MDVPSGDEQALREAIIAVNGSAGNDNTINLTDVNFFTLLPACSEEDNVQRTVRLAPRISREEKFHEYELLSYKPRLLSYFLECPQFLFFTLIGNSR